MICSQVRKFFNKEYGYQHGYPVYNLIWKPFLKTNMMSTFCSPLSYQSTLLNRILFFHTFDLGNFDILLDPPCVVQWGLLHIDLTCVRSSTIVRERDE